MATDTGPEVSEVRRDLLARTARDGAAFDLAMGDLGRAIRTELSLGERVADYPLPWIAAAFAFGMYMGLR